MFCDNQPTFEANTVLRSEMLQESADYAREILQHRYSAYSDGIIEGVTVEAEENFLTINPGILKYQGRIYHMSTPAKIRYMQTNKCTYLRIRFRDKIETQTGIQYTSEIIVTEDATDFPYEMELARFVPEKGAKLYAKYSGFADLATQINRLDIRYVPYAGRGESTISPMITTLFAREMGKKNLENPYDIVFVMQCLAKTPMDREVICTYLDKRGMSLEDREDNGQIYQALSRILKQPAQIDRQIRRPPTRIIVD